MTVQPKVSVLMTTYKHEKFIAQAIESVLMQETDFTFEVVIGEDKSPDDTRRIVEDYQRHHPDRIRLFAREQNLGAHNFVETYWACRGKYVAILEGDDYWTDRKKLQAQVDALDAHSDWVMCFHTVRCVGEGGLQPPYPFLPLSGWKEVSTFDDLLKWNFVPTCSMVFRNGIVRKFPEWYFSLAMGDWPFSIMLAQHGKLGYIARVMADYRLHAGGAWSSKDMPFRMKAELEMYRHVRQIVDGDRAAQVTERIVERTIELADGELELGLVSKARITLWGLLLRESVLRRGFPRRRVLRRVLQIDAPTMLRMAVWIRRKRRRDRSGGLPSRSKQGS